MAERVCGGEGVVDVCGASVLLRCVLTLHARRLRREPEAATPTAEEGTPPEQAKVTLADAASEVVVKSADYWEEKAEVKLDGEGHVQFNGKGKFVPFKFKLEGGVFTMSNDSGSRTAELKGCSISRPKKARKGHEHASRMDLAEAESGGEKKLLVSFQDAAELKKWTEAFAEYDTKALAVLRMSSKPLASMLASTLEKVNVDMMELKIWRGYMASLSKEEQKDAEGKMQRGTSSDSAYAKEAYHKLMEAGLALAKETKLAHMPAADQLDENELYLVENAYMWPGHKEGGAWCHYQFGAAPEPEPEPEPKDDHHGHGGGGHH